MSKPLVRWALQPSRSAVVVVDMQKVFCEPQGALYVPATAAIVQPIAALVEAARAAAVPVIYLRHVVRGDGSDTGRMRDLYPNVDDILARDDPGIEIIERWRHAPATWWSTSCSTAAFTTPTWTPCCGSGTSTP